MNTERLRATAYYRKTIRALSIRPEKNDYQGWGIKLNVRFQGGSQAWFWVDPYNHYLLGIEASGILDLSDLSGRPETKLPLCYSSKNQWKVYPHAQWGIGNRLNPLVPGRDLANSQWAFGTRLIWGPPEKWVDTFRPEMFCGDVFGDPLKSADRVDLFAGEEITFGNPDIRGEVTPPWTGVSKSAVHGFQESMNILKIPGLNGAPLKPDNDWGPQTNFAMGAYLGMYRQDYPWGIPNHKQPNDPEIFFRVRETARNAS